MKVTIRMNQLNQIRQRKGISCVYIGPLHLHLSLIADKETSGCFTQSQLYPITVPGLDTETLQFILVLSDELYFVDNYEALITIIVLKVPLFLSVSLNLFYDLIGAI